MRLSLRTLLAFEDNVFDVEQHRRLEQLLPTDQAAESILQRIRSVVRSPLLGVPGLVDHQEELDPNYVAEYLDHQMPAGMQDKFESYCLSADKYLAEIASIHHILSNILGEPARTSRDCRLKCYNALLSDKNPLAIETKNSVFSTPEQPKHFRPYGTPQESNISKPAMNRYLAPFWNLLFPPPKTGHSKTDQQIPMEQKSSLWTFTVIGLLICTLLLGWQQLEKQRFTQKLYEVAETNTFVTEDPAASPFIAENNDTADIEAPFYVVHHPPNTIEQSTFSVPSEPLIPVEPIEQTAFTSESHIPSVTSVGNPFLATAELPPTEPTELEPLKSENTLSDNVPNGDFPAVNITKQIEIEEKPAELNESIIAFQPIKSSSKTSLDIPVRQTSRPPIPVSAWQSQEMPVTSAPVSAVPVQRSQPYPQPITQTSGTAPRVLGQAIPMPQPSLIFSATTSSDSWQLPSLPFDLNGEQYLLTATPFRGMFELAASFHVEMIGDTKLCILPLDASGVPGIFVDYGRIIIRPLKPNQPLRIETEKSRGMTSSTGINSILFIDTFAEISDPPNSTKPAEGQKPKTCPILGFVPKNGEQIVWKSISQPQPFYVDSQGSILLQSDQYQFGEIRLPSWLGTIPMSPEDRMLAETCRRCFVDTRGNSEEALMWLIQNESRTVRTLGFRLWGDLGRFDIPLTVMAEKRKEDETIRLVLVQYFNEVMRRDAETVQRFADAIEIIKEARRN